MYCRQCGTLNDNNAWKCISCGATVQGVAPTPPGLRAQAVPNYLVQAILVTLFCLWPIGIPAIVFATKVNSLVAAGDIAGAQEASKKAKLFCWISFGIGLALTIGIVLFYGVILIIALANNAS